MRLIASLAIFLSLAGCGSITPPAKAPTVEATASVPAAPPKASGSVPTEAPKASEGAPAQAPPASKGTAPAKAPVKSAPQPTPPALAAIRSGPAAPATAPLDLKSLEQRLTDTNAVGMLAKLALKNQMDDLIAQFHAFHSGQRPPMTLAELRRPFELLLMKVLSLLQDKDIQLAHDINASREAIWAVLSDREKLEQFL